MRNLRQWIAWRLVERPGDPKPTKLPVDPRTGAVCNAQDPSVWLSYDEVVASGHRPGFVFTSADPYFFLDLDAAADPGGGWRPYVGELTSALDGGCVELSQSGTGLHVFGRYSGPAPAHGCKCLEIGGELYTSGRFVALGSATPESLAAADTDLTGPLHALAQRYFPPSLSGPGDWRDGPREDWTGPTDDDDLIRRARASKSIFGGAASFEALWTGDIDALAEAYPDHTGRSAYDGSRADSALARHLAFWTGCDSQRIWDLMLRSGLARDKWNREDYMRMTVSMACGGDPKVFDYVAPPVGDAQPAIEGVRSGYQFLSVPDQLALFAGCVYVWTANKIMMPGGELVGRDQFNAIMPCYLFAMDTTGKATTKKPWEAFTGSLATDPPIAECAVFEPKLPTVGVIEHHGRKVVNTYRPSTIHTVEGDATPLIRHVTKLLPDERDAEILLSYMASLVQNLGTKFRWAPVIQGIDGNGKSLIGDIMRYCVGHRHTYSLRSNSLGARFNAWLGSNMLVLVDDADVSISTIERMKPMITNPIVEMEAKHEGALPTSNHANFLINCNARNGIPKTSRDRRYAILYTAQQDPGDKERDGLTADYFSDLLEWLEERNGFAICRNHLLHKPIDPALDPAKRCLEAPRTSSTDEAIEASASDLVEQIRDLIDSGYAGCRGDWASRTRISERLDAFRIEIRDVRKALGDMGYTSHPALPRGRTNNPVNPDLKRAELWVRRGSDAERITRAADAEREYEISQTGIT